MNELGVLENGKVTAEVDSPLYDHLYNVFITNEMTDCFGQPAYVVSYSVEAIGRRMLASFRLRPPLVYEGQR